VTIHAWQSSAKSMPPISTENGPLSASIGGSSHCLARSHAHRLPQQAWSSVQATSAQGAIGTQMSTPLHTVPGPHSAPPHGSDGPARTQASSGALHSPLMTSHTWSGPHGSGSCP
jgi:hypothetical protein